MPWRCSSQSPCASHVHCRQSWAPRTASSSGKPSSIWSKLVLRSSGRQLGHVRRRAHLEIAGVDVDEHRRHLAETADVLVDLALRLERIEEGRAAQVVQLPRDGLHVGAAQEGGHAPSRLLALGDGLDHGLCAEHGVAAGEDVGVGGLQGPVVDRDGTPAGVGDAFALAGAVELRVLADGADDLVALDHELRALERHGAATAGRVGLAELHADHLDAVDLAGVVGEHPDGGYLEHQTNALLLGLVDLGVVGGHLLARAAVEAGDLLGASTDGRPAGVHGGEPAADDRHLLAAGDGAVALEIAEEVDGRDDAVGVLALAAHGVGVEGAQGEEHGVVLGAQVVQPDVDAETHAGLQLDAHAPQDGELLVDDVAGQAVAGDAVAEHAPGMWHGLEDLDGVPFEARVEGGGEAGRPAADDGDAFAGRGLGLVGQEQLARLLAGSRLVGHEPVELADGDGLFDELAPAGGLAGPRAHAPEDAGEGQVLAQDPHAALVVALADAVQELGDLDMRGAGVAAGRRAV